MPANKKRTYKPKEPASVRHRRIAIPVAIEIFREHGVYDTAMKEIREKTNLDDIQIRRAFGVPEGDGKDPRAYIAMAIFSCGYERLETNTRDVLLRNNLDFNGEDVKKILMTISETIFNLMKCEEKNVSDLIYITFVEAGISGKVYEEMKNILGENAKNNFFGKLDKLFEKGCKKGIPALEARLGFWGIIEHTLFAKPAGIGEYEEGKVLQIIDIFLKSVLEQTGVCIDDVLTIDIPSKSEIDRTINCLQQLSLLPRGK